MPNSSSSASLRRSSRVPVNVPILVTSLEPGTQFSEVCETMVVNAHGCAMRSTAKLDAGVLLHFHSKDGREATAKVVSCQPLDTETAGWRLGARLDQPENFWGLKTVPQDWLPSPTVLMSEILPAKLITKTFHTIQPMPEKIPASLKMMLDNLQKQVSDERLHALVSDAMQPLHAEVAELRERVARAQTKERSRFEVSLSQIPPELQVQIEGRLRKELVPRVLDETRAQSEQVLQSAKNEIQKTTAESHTEFRQRVSEDLRAVEDRVEAMSAEVVENLRDHLRREMGEFHLHVVEAGNRLKRLSEELLQLQQRALAEKYAVHRRELEQSQATGASELSRLRAEVADLDGRIAKLYESARELESGLDVRLSKLASNTVSSARTQLENTVDAILEDLGKRSSQQLGEQVDEAGVRLGVMQKGIENAVAESIQVQAVGRLGEFEKTLDELARKSVDRCQGALAKGLNSLARSLGEQFRLD